jgi:hypothetical protein
MAAEKKTTEFALKGLPRSQISVCLAVKDTLEEINACYEHWKRACIEGNYAYDILYIERTERAVIRKAVLSAVFKEV